MKTYHFAHLINEKGHVPIGALSRQGLHDWLNAIALCLVFMPPGRRAAWLTTCGARVFQIWPTLAQADFTRDLEALVHRAGTEWQIWKQQHAPEVGAKA